MLKLTFQIVQDVIFDDFFLISSFLDLIMLLYTHAFPVLILILKCIQIVGYYLRSISMLYQTYSDLHIKREHSYIAYIIVLKGNNENKCILKLISLSELEIDLL